jgi:trigger factor
MNINKEQIDDLNIIVSVQIGNDDYGNKVGEVLRDFRRKANMPGFRPGKVPEGLIRKMYGKSVLVDEINKLVSESLQNYIKEQDLKLLGDPLPKVSGDDLDWEIGNDFSFEFEMGLAPNIEVNLSKDIQLTKYQIEVSQEMIDRDVENYCRRFGQFVDVDSVAEFNEKLTGDIVQLDSEGQPSQNGISAEDTSFSILPIKDDERKKPFENAKAGDEIAFNLSETFTNKWEVASILKKKDQEEVGDISGSLFKFTVKNIQRYVNAELNQELYDKVFGEGAVTNSEDFENKIWSNIGAEFEESSMSKFSNDAFDYLVEKINPPLPEEFLRKWLKSRNNEISDETFEKEFPQFLKNMKWELISNTITKQYELKVEEQEIIDSAKAATRRQLTMYGISNISDEHLTGYAMNNLKDEKTVRATAVKVLENKIAKIVLDAVDVSIQEMSLDDFNKMIYGSNDSEGEDEINEESSEDAEIVENTDVSGIEENIEAAKIEENVEVAEDNKNTEVIEVVESVEVAENNENAEVAEVEKIETTNEVTEVKKTKKKKSKKSIDNKDE